MAAALLVGGLCLAAAVSTGRSAASPGTQALRPAESRIAGSGINLLENPGAEVGDASAAGWDAVTIPGWQVLSGLPTVVRYGTPGFPSRGSPGPKERGRQLFAGGAGGTAELVQDVRLHSPSGRQLGPKVRYVASGWFGGPPRSQGSAEVRFLSSNDQSLGFARIGPVTARGLEARRATGTLPVGTTELEFTVVLTTSLTDNDGPNAPQVGYDWAMADDLGLSISAPVLRAQPLSPPVANVPHFDHVFLFYFENEDFRSVIGNTVDAPYLNGLLPRASLLGNFYAEEHPSDGNYLSLAGGSTFGIPLDDPLEENPEYTIDARNIGDLITSAHESWKGYLQSADGPCDDTVHGSYWNDDLPMLYFRDVRDRPAYCASHLVPLQELGPDLEKTATTPSFAWISPNDCTDMEGCGITAGDSFLANTLGEILRSPAFRTQRSLVIITFDEDGYDFERPAQLVPTVVLGSTDVKQGYVSFVRYTHYSLLRTIEAALGLGTLTENDRYAQPLNDVFDAAG